MAAGITVLVLLYWGALFAAQRRLLFPRARVTEQLARPPDAQQIWLATPAGRVEAWYLPPLVSSAPRGPSPLLLYTHGNGELIDYWPAELEEPRRWGFALLLVEYPGYGRSEGAPSEQSIRDTMLAAYDWVHSRSDIDATRIVAHGRSLGGGAACLLAASRPVAALILESTFTSVRAFAKRFGAPGFLVRDPFDNMALVRAYERPLLVLHGDHDEVIPFAQGRALAAAARQAEFHALPCGHNDCDRAWPLIRDFLARHQLMPPLPIPPSAER